MLGSNVPTRGGLTTAFRYAKEWKCESIQIYVAPSRKWDVTEISPDEISEFKQAWRRSSVKQVVAHAPLLVNLASPNNAVWKKSINRLITEISRTSQLQIPFLVMHPGSPRNSPKKFGIARITEGLNIVLQNADDCSTKILLETMAGQGTMIGSCFEEIANITEKVENSELLGVCIDTAHVFAAGYDIRGYEGYERVLDIFDNLIGIGSIKVIHLNDSKTSLGSRVDRHASIGEGELGLQVFQNLLRDRRFCNIPKILEIPKQYERSKSNLQMLRKLQSTHYQSQIA
jgi:deoxyribonuclease-4